MGDKLASAMHPYRHPDDVLDEAAAAIRTAARAHIAAGRGHMTWAEAIVVLEQMKTQVDG